MLKTDITEKKPLSDQEVHYMGVEEWYKILESMWIAIGKEVDKERLLIYGKELGNVPCEILERAISRVHMSSSYATIPTIGEIWQAAKVELAIDHCSTPEEWFEWKWNYFMGRVRYTEGIHER